MADLKNTTQAANSETKWHVLMGDQKYGPYDYKTVIEMLQTNQLMDYNFVWSPHLTAWTQINQLDEFSKERFQILLQKESEYLASFIRRNNNRTEVDVAVLGHNHIRFFDGVVSSISEAGALCLLNTPLLQVGDKLKLHMKAGPGNPNSFNVECEIIRKNFSKQRLNSKSGLYYAVRFHDIQPVGVKQIQTWVSEKAA